MTFVVSPAAGPYSPAHRSAVRRQPASFLHRGGVGWRRLDPGATAGVCGRLSGVERCRPGAERDGPLRLHGGDRLQH